MLEFYYIKFSLSTDMKQRVKTCPHELAIYNLILFQISPNQNVRKIGFFIEIHVTMSSTL